MNEGSKGEILFMDNDLDTREMAKTVLEIAGYDTVVASSRKEGLQSLRREEFDFILLDWHLEDGTGIDLCRWVRCLDKQTPIFFYTGVAYPKQLEKALEAGAQGYFVKPVDIGLLLQTIETQLGQSQR